MWGGRFAGGGHSPVAPWGDGALVGFTVEACAELQRGAGTLAVPPAAAMADGGLLQALQLRHQLHRHVVVPAQTAAKEMRGGLAVLQLARAVAVDVGMVRGAAGAAQAMAQHQGAQQCQGTEPALRESSGQRGTSTSTWDPAPTPTPCPPRDTARSRDPQQGPLGGPPSSLAAPTPPPQGALTCRAPAPSPKTQEDAPMHRAPTHALAPRALSHLCTHTHVRIDTPHP